VGAVTFSTGTLNTNGQTQSWGSFTSTTGSGRTLTLPLLPLPFRLPT
jgi:hypothetical protein